MRGRDDSVFAWRDDFITRLRDDGNRVCCRLWLALTRARESDAAVGEPEKKAPPALPRFYQADAVQGLQHRAKLVFATGDFDLRIEQKREFLDGSLIMQPHEFPPLNHFAFCAVEKKTSRSGNERGKVA